MCVVATLILAGCGFSEAVTEDAGVYVPHGTTWEVLRDSLAGKVAEPARVMWEGEPATGYYKLRKGLTYRELTRLFERGWQSPVRVTFNNQPTLQALAGRIGRQLEVDSSEVAAVLLDDSLAVSYGLDSQTFIAMFLPDTYEFYWTTTSAEFVDKMHAQWEKFWDGTRDRKLEKLGMTRAQATTLASIVYEETKVEEEMPRVAGVYVNRLARGIALQADPTVKFAIVTAGGAVPKRILNRHLKLESPYNTYINRGLPPGPITMPSKAAIDAVLNYEAHDYIYFAAKPDFSGSHSFAATLAEHNRNANAYRRALDAAGIR